MERNPPLSNLPRFARLVGRRESAVDLAEASLLIAQDAYPDLEVGAYLERLDDLAEPLRPRWQAYAPLEDQLALLNEHLFGEIGFRGNREDYYDPRNSYLNEVLDRKLGLPITLSVVYMEVARRLGLSVFGVGLPGHFIVTAERDGTSLLLDPFNGGKVLTPQDCEGLVRESSENTVPFSDAQLAPVRKRQILTRMLNNLKNMYMTRDDPAAAWPVVEKMVCLNPDCAADRRDRGLVAYRLNNFAQARQDLRYYLDHRPDAADRVAVQVSLAAVEAILSIMA
jgi:regulator of sirC expression with transglutaminase-like and TPR domain